MQAWPSNIGYNLESRLSDNVYPEIIGAPVFLSLAWEVRHLIVGNVGNCRSYYAEKGTCMLSLVGMQGSRCGPNSTLSCKCTSASLQPALCWHVHSNTGKGALVWRVICWPEFQGNRSRNCWIKLSVTYSTAHLWSAIAPCYSPNVSFSFGNCLFFFSQSPKKD